MRTSVASERCPKDRTHIRTPYTNAAGKTRWVCRACKQEWRRANPGQVRFYGRQAYQRKKQKAIEQERIEHEATCENPETCRIARRLAMGLRP